MQLLHQYQKKSESLQFPVRCKMIVTAIQVQIYSKLRAYQKATLFFQGRHQVVYQGAELPQTVMHQVKEA
ncbi:hypothetical protein ACS0TY_010022 [Phlomoides rotata]